VVTPLRGDNMTVSTSQPSPDTCLPAPLLLLVVIPNGHCQSGTLQHLLWRLMLWRLPSKQCLPLPMQLLQRLGQHTLVLVVAHKPSQGESIWGTQHVWQAQLRVSRTFMLQARTLNHVWCHAFDWQLTTGISMACRGAELAHPLSPCAAV
jgi:hypothetical protein